MLLLEVLEVVLNNELVCQLVSTNHQLEDFWGQWDELTPPLMVRQSGAGTGFWSRTRHWAQLNSLSVLVFLSAVADGQAASDAGRWNTKGVRADQSCLATASEEPFGPMRSRWAWGEPSEHQRCRVLWLLKQTDKEAASSKDDGYQHPPTTTQSWTDGNRPTRQWATLPSSAYPKHYPIVHQIKHFRAFLPFCCLFWSKKQLSRISTWIDVSLSLARQSVRWFLFDGRTPAVMKADESRKAEPELLSSVNNTSLAADAERSAGIKNPEDGRERKKTQIQVTPQSGVFDLQPELLLISSQTVRRRARES